MTFFGSPTFNLCCTLICIFDSIFLKTKGLLLQVLVPILVSTGFYRHARVCRSSTYCMCAAFLHPFTSIFSHIKNQTSTIKHHKYIKDRRLPYKFINLSSHPFLSVYHPNLTSHTLFKHFEKMIFSHKRVWITALVTLNISRSSAFSIGYGSRTMIRSNFLLATVEDETKIASDTSEPHPSQSSKDLDNEHAKSEIFNPITSNTAFSTYQSTYEQSISDPSTFWKNESQKRLTWFTEPNTNENALHGDLTNGDVKFFPGGKLNICYNAIDRHALANNGKGGDDIAMIWEGDEPSDTKSYTYNELLSSVSQIANALKAQGVQKGDKVTIYMPMIAELPMTMLACAR